MERLRGISRIGAIVAAEVLAIVVLRGLGSNDAFAIDWNDLGSWFSHTSLPTLISASARLLALGMAYYMLTTTVLYIVLSVLGIDRAKNALGAVTLPGVRRSVDKAFAVAIISTSILGGSASYAMAAGTPIPGFPSPTTEEGTSNDSGDSDQPSISQLFPGLPGANPSTPTTSTTEKKSTTTEKKTTTTSKNNLLPGLGANTTTTTEPEAPQAPEQETPAPSEDLPQVQGEQSYRVGPGDNLWNISKAHLASVRGVDPSTLSDSDIAQYWIQVINVNQPTLRSGDPDLIYPGEAITLPSV